MLDGPTTEGLVPAVTKAVVSEAAKPAVPVTNAEAVKAVLDLANDVKGAERENNHSDEKDTNTGTPITAEDHQEIGNAQEQADKNSKTFPEGYRVILTDLTAGGDVAKNLELTGQAMREKANAATIEGEGTKEQKMQLALGYDVEIGGLQIKLDRTKNQKEKQVLSDKIKILQQEKITKTGIKENQLDGLAELFSMDENSAKFIGGHIKEGTPMVAVVKILEQAIVDKNLHQAVITKLRESGLSDDQKKLFEKSLNDKARVKKIEKGAKMVGIGSLIGMILMMYTGFKKEKQGMG